MAFRGTPRGGRGGGFGGRGGFTPRGGVWQPEATQDLLANARQDAVVLELLSDLQTLSSVCAAIERSKNIANISQEMGKFVHDCENEMFCESINTKIPYFNAPIYLENKVHTQCR
jgi:H/ACA ribonucleoprotein complex subunit 1